MNKEHLLEKVDTVIRNLLGLYEGQLIPMAFQELREDIRDLVALAYDQGKLDSVNEGGNE